MENEVIKYYLGMFSKKVFHKHVSNTEFCQCEVCQKAELWNRFNKQWKKSELKDLRHGD